MQLFVLALVLALFMHDGNLGGDAQPQAIAPWLSLWVLVFVPKIAVALIYTLLCRITYRRLGHSGGGALLRWLDRLTLLYRWSAVAFFGLDLRLGALAAIRQFLGGNLILIDELLVLAPTLAMIGWSWWAFYPIDIRLRQASLISRLDQAQPLFPLWTRGQYIISQARHQVALMLVPLLLMMGWTEVVQSSLPSAWRWTGGDPRPMFILAGAGGVFLVAPLMMRHIWDTAPLPSGDLRDRLLAMCQQHGVRVRELLLWRTFGGIINAAVMGLVAPLRYILLTDALVEMVPNRQIEAVMAHEVAHVRRHHMFWLVAAAGGTLGALEGGWILLMSQLPVYGSVDGGIYGSSAAQPVATAGWNFQFLADPEVLAAAATVAALVSWVLVFGWISRRFERQADTFAVQHMASQSSQPDSQQRPGTPGSPGSPGTIDAGSVQVMIDALQQIAALNNIVPTRRSWRHGSIAWRQNYLRSLVGQPIGNLPIDNVVRRIKLLNALLLAGLMALYAYDMLR